MGEGSDESRVGDCGLSELEHVALVVYLHKFGGGGLIAVDCKRRGVGEAR